MTADDIAEKGPLAVVGALLWYRMGRLEGHQELIMRRLKIEGIKSTKGGLLGMFVILSTILAPTNGCALNRPFLMSVTTDTNGAVTRSVGKITTIAVGPGMSEVMKQTARQSPKSGQSIGQTGIETSAGLTTNETKAIGDLRAILGR